MSTPSSTDPGSGKDQGPADALSRLPLPEEPKDVPVPGDLLLLMEHLDCTLPVMKQQVEAWTDKDPTLSRVRRLVQLGEWANEGEGEEVNPSENELSVLGLSSGDQE